MIDKLTVASCKDDIMTSFIINIHTYIFNIHDIIFINKIIKIFLKFLVRITFFYSLGRLGSSDLFAYIRPTKHLIRHRLHVFNMCKICAMCI